MDCKALLGRFNSMRLCTNLEVTSEQLGDACSQHEPSRIFLQGLQSISENILDVNELRTEEEISAIFTTLDDNSLSSKITDTYMETKLESTNEYIDALQNINEKLKKKLNYLINTQIDDSVQIQEVQKIGVDRGNMMLEDLKKEIADLSDSCGKLHSVVCQPATQPKLLLQLPIDQLILQRKEFDDHIKSYVMKQFVERIPVISGCDDPIIYSPENRYELVHFVSGPLKEHYDQQCKELDRLQADYYVTLRDLHFKKAKVAGYRFVIDAIEKLNEGLNNSTTNERELLSEIATREWQLDLVASKYSSSKVDSLMICNFAVKKHRLQYYINCIDKLLKLLKKQLSVETLTEALAEIEYSCVMHTCNYLETVSKLFQEGVDEYNAAFCTIEGNHVAQVPEHVSLTSNSNQAKCNTDTNSEKIIFEHVKLLQDYDLLLNKTRLLTLFNIMEKYNNLKMELLNEEPANTDSFQECAMFELVQELEVYKKNLNDLLLELKLETVRRATLFQH